jgi:hypothetical protein
MKTFIAIILSFFWTLLSAVGSAQAHGVIGKRFIPSTLALEDPFPSDEVDLLSVNRAPKDQEGRETSLGFEFGKRLTPDFAISVGWEYIFFNPREAGARSTSGAGNPEFGVKYSILKSAEHEGIVSIGLEVEAGGAGSRRVAERVTTISPTLLFGKGLGDLPDSLTFLKPFSVTGSLAVANPANRFTGSGEDKERNPTTIDYGVAIMYSVPYLQSFVKDVGLTAPFDRMFPIVEFNMSTNVSKPQNGRTTAFANPGVMWAGKYVQLGMEAQVPMNNASGKNVGIRGLIHVFVDDIWPNVFTWTPWGVIGPTPTPK